MAAENTKEEMKPQLIVALDVKDRPSACNIVNLLGDRVQWYKVGLELFVACGTEIIKTLRNEQKKVFLDLKLHDIPNTVAGAVKSAVTHGVSMITVHAGGGGNMVRAAVESAGNNTKIIAVTVLTSLSEDDLNVQGITRSVQEHVTTLAELAISNGAHGIVCSPHEVPHIRSIFGKVPLIITPGIRLEMDAKEDQKRTGSPESAVEAGADFLVVGRPIIRASSPVQVVDEVIQRIESAWVKKKQISQQ